MRVAVIGSRSLTIANLEKYLPANVTEIVFGGARGIDSSAREYARSHGLHCTEFLPEYGKYGRFAPLKRNRQIVEYADLVLAFWDGKSRGTAYVIRKCREMNVPYKVFRQKDEVVDDDTENPRRPAEPGSI